MFFHKMRIKIAKRSVLWSSTNILQMFWAYSHWIQVNSFLWALNEMETMMVVVFNQFRWRMDYQFVKKTYPHSHRQPTVSPWKDYSDLFLFGEAGVDKKKHLPSSLCFVWHNWAQLDTFMMCTPGSRGASQGLATDFLKKLKLQQTNKQTSFANH